MYVDVLYIQNMHGLVCSNGWKDGIQGEQQVHICYFVVSNNTKIVQIGVGAT